jgi:hypothetical protein
LIDNCKELFKKITGTVREKISRFFGFIGHASHL